MPVIAITEKLTDIERWLDYIVQLQQQRALYTSRFVMSMYLSLQASQ